MSRGLNAAAAQKRPFYGVVFLCWHTFQESLFSEAKLKRLKLNKVNFSSADFFKTPLKGIDLSDCMIDGILVSDTYHELKGVMVNALQAAELIKILGVKVV